MLESEIKNLNESVQKLTAAVEAQTALFARFEAISKDAGRQSLTDSAAKWEADGLSAPDDIKAEIEDKPAPAADPEPSASDPTTSTVSRDDLQAKCMSIVRADRKKRGDVEALIAKFGGTLIRDVPEDKLAELAVELENLV